MKTLMCELNCGKAQEVKRGNSEMTSIKAENKTSSQTKSLGVDKLEIIPSRSQSTLNFRQNNVQSNPYIPTPSKNLMAAKSSFEYTITTRSYGGERSNGKALTIAEITIDDWEIIATVKVENGKTKIEFEDDFEPTFFIFCEKDFAETVQRAAKELGAEDI